VADFLRAPGDFELVRFVLFGEEAYQAYEEALKGLLKQKKDG
jgi:O-acetyl-ADP-ribose deacetylase (regulator of RNase III)